MLSALRTRAALGVLSAASSASTDVRQRSSALLAGVPSSSALRSSSRRQQNQLHNQSQQQQLCRKSAQPSRHFASRSAFADDFDVARVEQALRSADFVEDEEEEIQTEFDSEELKKVNFPILDAAITETFQQGRVCRRAYLHRLLHLCETSLQFKRCQVAVMRFATAAVPAEGMTLRLFMDAAIRTDNGHRIVDMLRTPHLIRMWPKMPHYHDLIRSLARSKRAENPPLIISLLDIMARKGTPPSDRTYLLILSELNFASPAAAPVAIQVWRRYLDTKPTKFLGAGALHTVMFAFEKAGDPASVLDLYRTAFAPGAAEAAGEAGEAAAALPVPSLRTHQLVLSAHLLAGDDAAALALTSRVPELRDAASLADFVGRRIRHAAMVEPLRRLCDALRADGVAGVPDMDAEVARAAALQEEEERIAAAEMANRATENAAAEASRIRRPSVEQAPKQEVGSWGTRPVELRRK